MTSCRVLRAAERRVQPWKNGGGVTREVIAASAGARPDDVDWRISVAEIALDGPFSIFDAIDRVLVVLEGTLELRLETAEVLQLHPGSDPLGFPGESRASAMPADRVVHVLNVMTRRERYRAHVERPRIGQAAARTREWPASSVVFAPEPVRIEVDGQAIDLERHDAISVDGVVEFCSPDEDGCDILLVTLLPHQER